MNFDALRQNVVDVVEEGQIKLGYRSETVRLYYPLASLCAFVGEAMDAERMGRALHVFARENRDTLGDVEITCRGDRFCIAVPPQGVAYIHEHTDPNGFLTAFVRAIGRHGCILEDLLEQFRRYSDHVHVEALHNGEFDYLIYFEDGRPDAYRYCVTDEGCHMTYHRFTREDYEAFGF